MVDPVDGRTAFELSLVQQRKDRSRITGLAVDNDGLRFYVGLDTGFIEEHRVVYGPTGCVARVCARRQASKKPVKDVCLLGGAAILAVLIEDGHLLLCDLDQLDPVPLSGVQNVMMVAGDPRYLSPCRFAIGVKSGLRKSRVDVYELSREWEAQPNLLAQYPMPEDIKGLGFLDEDIVVSSKSAYYAIHSGQMRLLLEPSAPAMFIVLPIPSLFALLWEDSLGVVSDSTGAAARPPLLFDSKPLLLTQGGMCVVAVNSSGGIAIYDQKTSKLVQRIPFDVKNLFVRDEEVMVLHHADTPSGSTILLASAHYVWMLRPVAHEAQTTQLLKSGNIEAALELAENCIAESWAEDVFAQAGMLLLQDCQWKFALECFERCSPSVFQPSQLFPLFPKYTRKWAEQVCLKSYWGLHVEVTELKFIAMRRSRSESERSDCESGTSGRDIQEEKNAQHHIANYLLKVSASDHSLGAVPGLALANLEQLELFVQSDHMADLDDVRNLLVRQQQFIALALLCWKRRAFAEALNVLKDLSFKKCSEMKAKSGSVRQGNGNQERVAIFYASRVLMDPGVESRVVEEHLRWLVKVSSARFLAVCQVSPLLPSAILKIIPENQGQLRFRYLHHLVHTGLQPTQESRYHTQLATALCDLLEGRSDFNKNEQKLPFMFASDDNYYQYPDCELSQSQTNILQFDSELKPKLVITAVDPPDAFFESDELYPFSGQELRDILQHHLLLSKGYDAVEVLRNLENSQLYEEQVILNCRLQDHVQALRLLAVTLRDIRSAIRYCKLYAGSEGFIKLLDMLLKPGDGEEPLFSEAVQVLNAESGNLDPMRVLDALSETMPLSIAYSTLARMLRERTHRRRQTRITHNLQRLQNVLYRAEKYDLESSIAGRVYVDADTECVLCRKPLEGRIFYKYPSGATVCGMCHRERQTPLD